MKINNAEHLKNFEDIKGKETRNVIFAILLTKSNYNFTIR